MSKMSSVKLAIVPTWNRETWNSAKCHMSTTAMCQVPHVYYPHVPHVYACLPSSATCLPSCATCLPMSTTLQTPHFPQSVSLPSICIIPSSLRDRSNERRCACLWGEVPITHCLCLIHCLPILSLSYNPFSLSPITHSLSLL